METDNSADHADLEKERNVSGNDRHSKVSDWSDGQPHNQSQIQKNGNRCEPCSGQMEEEAKHDGKEEGDSGVPIDEGWAWIIVVGCFIMHIFCVGGIKSFGVFFVELEERFETSSKALGFVQAIASTLMLGLGPVSNALSLRFTCRSVVMVGGLLAGCGFICTAFIPSFPWLYLTYGVMTGIGFGLSYAPFVVMVGHHFVKRRSLANGISVSGSGVGQFVLPNLVRYLLNEYSFQGCLLIIGGLMLNICMCGALIRPLASYKKRKTTKVQVEDDEKAKLDSSFEQSDPVGHLTETNKLLDKRILQLSHNKKEMSGSSHSLDAEVHHKNRLLDSKLRYFSEDVTDTCGSKHSLDGKRRPPKRFYSVEVDDSHVKSSPLQHRRLRHLSETESFKSETSLFASTGDLVIASLQNIPELDAQIEVEVEEIEMKSSTCPCLKICQVSEVKSKSSVPLFDWALLVNPVFIVYIFSVLIANFGYPNIFIMLPSYCEELGYDKDKAALLFSIIGISDLCGRLFFGWFSDLKLFPRQYGFLGTMAISGVLSIMLSQIKHYEMLVFYCCTFGFFAGSYIALIAVVLVDCLGVDKLSSAFGLTTLAMSLSLLAGPPIVGGIRDSTDSWEWSFMFSGMAGILGAGIVLFEPLAQRRLKSKEKPKEVELDVIHTDDTLLDKS